MNRFEGHEVRRATGAAGGDPSGSYSSVAIDSRSVERGALFFALPGARVHGVTFLDQAIRRGATGAVIPTDADVGRSDVDLFRVPDTLRALGDLARFARRRAHVRVIGVTGSSGKTTVKEMLAVALGEGASTWATPGNLNSLTGLPLSIIRADPGADFWVLELGSNAPGEIARLTAIAEPDDAVVTTVGMAHIEGFGDLSGVMREKLALLRGAQPGGCAVVGDQPEELPAAARQVRADVVVAGLGSKADVRPSSYETGAESSRFEFEGETFQLSVGGRHHVQDAMLAVAVARRLGAPLPEVARGLARYRPVGMRGALVRAGPLTIVADCYNANPDSFDAVIRYCEQAFAGRPMTAVVGSMLELGERSAPAHERVARHLIEAGFSTVYAFGAFRTAFDGLEAPGAVIERPETLREAVESIRSHGRIGEVVLVKASRGERLERVVDGLREQANGEAA